MRTNEDSLPIHEVVACFQPPLALLSIEDHGLDGLDEQDTGFIVEPTEEVPRPPPILDLLDPVERDDGPVLRELAPSRWSHNEVADPRDELEDVDDYITPPAIVRVAPKRRVGAATIGLGRDVSTGIGTRPRAMRRIELVRAALDSGSS